MSSYDGSMMAIVRSALVLLIVIGAGNAYACQCTDETGPPCQSFFQVDAVFAGTVKAVTLTPRAPGVMENVRVEFGDAISFRGVAGTAQTVLTASDSAACGYAF